MVVEEIPVRSLRRRLSPQQIEEVVARYNAGEDTPALSRAYDISRGASKTALGQGSVLSIATNDTRGC